MTQILFEIFFSMRARLTLTKITVKVNSIYVKYEMKILMQHLFLLKAKERDL